MVFVLVVAPASATLGEPTPTSQPSVVSAPATDGTAPQKKLTKCKKIDSSGTYVLSGSIDADEYDRIPCIEVTASDVVIKGSGMLSNGAISVGSDMQRLSDVTVKNINLEKSSNILFDGVTKATVTGVTFTGRASSITAISFTDVSEGEITDNQITGTSDDPPYGVRIDTSDGGGTSSDVRVENNAITGTKNGVVLSSSGRDDPLRKVTIRDNTIVNSTDEEGTGIQINSVGGQFSDPTYIEALSITGNTLQSNGDQIGAGGHGIGTDGPVTTVGLSITNNRVVRNTGGGISIGGQNRRTTIANNHVTGNGVEGIFFNGTDSVIRGNNASGNGNRGGFGLRISGQNVTVTGNTVNRNEIPAEGGTGGGGVEIHGTGHTITNNVVNGNSKGISLSGRRSVLGNNAVSGNVNRGIGIGGNNHTVVGNTMTNHTSPPDSPPDYGIVLKQDTRDTLLRNNTVRNNTVGFLATLDTGRVTNTVERLHIESPNRTTTISFSEGSVSGDPDRLLNISATGDPPDDPAGLRNINEYVTVTPLSGIFSTPSSGHINLTVHYGSGDLTGINESSLRMWTHREFGGWREAGEYNRVDRAENTVTGNVSLSGSTIVAPFARPRPRLRVVNSAGDAPDQDPGDGACDTGGVILRGGNEEAECTLRAAIQEANERQGRDTITFDIPHTDDRCDRNGNGICTIVPDSELPTVTDQVVIDGYTQPDAEPNTNAYDRGMEPLTGLNAKPKIVLNGTNAAGDGLNITAGDSTVKGLVIYGFTDGIQITEDGNNTIAGNFIGTGPRGEKRNVNSQNGIRITGEGADANMIGGPPSKPEARNLISGNGIKEGAGGVLIEKGAEDNSIAGNLIGTDIDGQQEVFNSFYGVRIGVRTDKEDDDGTDDNEVVRNLISGNADPDAFRTACFGAGVFIEDFAANNTVQTNLIGTDVEGAEGLGNLDGICIRDAGSQNTIQSNVIADNGRGILVLGGLANDQPGDNANDTRIERNRIGTNLAGTATLPNGRHGVFTGAPNTVIQNNLVSGNTGSGLFVSGDGAEILGNSIGTSRNGTTALGNDRSGIRLQTASGILIGGPKPDQRNLISGNGEYGIHVKGKNLDEHTVIQGNRIGTNRAGTGALANGKSGIYIEDASGTDIGGPFPEYGNLISGNSGHGIRVVGATTTVTNTSISNNQIGTDQAGNAGVGNGKSGVFLDNAVQSDIFDNVIASNGVSGDGVTVVSDSGTSQRNRISFNRMFRNGDLGIDLAKDGVTANDPGDPDDGPNRRQNFPNLTAATIDRTGNLVVSYRVPTAVANGAYPVGVEFFEADNSGREGKAVLGFVNYPARAAGTVRQANLGPALALGVAAGDSIVATATDARGSTSEFSANVTVERDNGTRDNATRIDFGDAPVNDTRYPTLSANAGPSHVVRAGFHLGETIDADPDGQPNATASGDDTDGTDDEDGVALNGPWTIDGEHRITVNASASGRLDAWIDWNADGDWRDPGEGIVTDANLSAGNNTLTVNVSSDAPTGKTFARFRFSSGGGLGPTGRASDGEVEDYNVTVVKGTGLDGTAGRYDTDDDGEISIGELGTAASDYAKGDLTITELGDVASAYASS